MISRHSQVRGLGEIHFFDQFQAVSTEQSPLTRAEAERIADRLLHHALDGFYRPHGAGEHARAASEIVATLSGSIDSTDVYRRVLRHCAGDRRWVIDKTPRYVTLIPEILATLPDALMVVITRDPRDVLLSQKHWYRALWEAREEVTRGIAVRHFLSITH